MKNKEIKILEKNNISSLKFIDVGARWGIQRPWNRFKYLKLDYLGFEPDKKECERLNLKAVDNSYINFLPFALSDKEKNEILHLTNEEGRSSIYEPNLKFLSKFHDSEGFNLKKKILINTSTLDKILTEYKINPDFIKIDTQGAELKILKGCKAFLDKLVGLELEVEFHQIYKKQPIFNEIDSFLVKKGFELFDLNRYWAKQKNLDSNHNVRGQIIFADAIYFRSIESFFEMNYENHNEKVNKFYKNIYSLSLYGFFDKALEFINHSEAPISETQKNKLISQIKNSSLYPLWQRLLLKNKIAFKFGLLFKFLSNKFMIYPNSLGWGTDYNNLGGRYLYYISEKANKFFGRK